jgi:hypothetical protein
MDWFWNLDNGSLPAWLSLVAGVVAGSVALRNLVHDRRDRRRGQAGKVACWWGTYTSARHNHPLPGFLVRNASHLPVYDALVTMQYGREIPHEHLIPLVVPSNEAQYVPPHEMDRALREPHGPWSVTMTFRDQTGRWWRRDERGLLSQLRRAPTMPKLAEAPGN